MRLFFKLQNSTFEWFYLFIFSEIRDRSNSTAHSSETCRSEDELTLDEDLPQNEPNKTSSLALSSLLSRSRQSLNEEIKELKPSKSPTSQRSISLGPKVPTFTSHVSVKNRQLSIPLSSLNSGVIYLPKEYNPALALNVLENVHNFFTKTFHVEISKALSQYEEQSRNSVLEQFPKDDFQYDDSIKNSFTNKLFTENFEGKVRFIKATKSYSFPIDSQNSFPYRSRSRNSQKVENQISCNYQDIIASRRIKELQILGCLIVEIFMPNELRALGSYTTKNFSSRLKSCLTVLKNCKKNIPPPITYIVNLLLQPETKNLENFKYPPVSNFGLPPPSAHLLLEPLLNCLIPFPRQFLYLYKLLADLKDFSKTADELNILYHFDCDGLMCSEYENIERTKVLFAQNIGECKVKNCAQFLELFFKEINVSTDTEIISILIPYIKQLIEDPPTSVLACWYLFDSVAKVLGPKKSRKIFLEPILKLYENEMNESTIPFHGKIAKLYHHSFLLRIMVRLGLKSFLENFITPLVEAIGGYRDYEKVDFVLHTHCEKVIKKISNLRNMVSEHTELSPSDDSTSSTHNSTIKDSSKSEPEPEMFEFENEESNVEKEPLQSLIEHLELNLSSDLPFGHSAAEEALDAALLENEDQISNLEELQLNFSEDEEGKYF